MPPYKEMYFHLFNVITAALQKLAEGDPARAEAILIGAQQWGEDRFIEAEERTKE